MIREKLANLLRYKFKKIDMSQETRIHTDAFVFARKPEFVSVINTIQREMFSHIPIEKQSSGKFMELGAGALAIKRLYPQVLATDIIAAPHLDGVLDATKLDLPDSTLDGIFLQNTFHHVPDPAAFFSEADRVLKINGKIVIVEPYWNKISSMLYPFLFNTETYNKGDDWFGASEHAMIGANQALSFIVFKRDINVFQKSTPTLRVSSSYPLRTGLRYLFSGGLNFKRIAPRPFFSILERYERRLGWLEYFSIHWIVVLTKEL